MKGNLDSIRFVNLFNQPESCPTLSLKDWEKFILILRASKLLSSYAQKVNQAGIFNELHPYAKRHFTNARVLADKQHKQIFFEAKELTKVISKSTEQIIFLKGAAYTLANNKASKGRVFSDIDVLVTKNSISSVERVLSIWGWLPEQLDQYDDKYYREWAHEIPPMQHASRGTVLDLHHNLVPPISGRAPDINQFVENAIDLKSGGLILRPAAMTLHSAIHLFINEDFDNGFRDIQDLHNLFTEFSHDDFWHDIIKLSKTTNFELELFLATRYSKHFFSTDIPTWVFNDVAKPFDNKIKVIFWDFIFKRALLPQHKFISVPQQSVACYMAFVRGHLLKMPLSILIKHTLHKLFKNVVTFVMGKAFFEKEDLHH